MKAPTIHYNGTSRNELVRDAEEFADKLYDAIEAGKRMGPNGRDYYPQGADALTEADKSYVDLMHRLLAIHLEVQDYIEDVIEAK